MSATVAAASTSAWPSRRSHRDAHPTPSRPTSTCFSGNTPGMPYLTWVMSKFMALGFTLEQVVAMATINPAKVINRAPKLGTLQIGAPADVAIIELVEGDVSFVDTRNNARTGRAYLKPVQTVTAGVPFGRPYNSPFAVR